MSELATHRPDTRPPAVAGTFYPAEPAALRRLVAACVDGVPAERRQAVAVLVPHAGLVYSGRCAGAVFGRVALPPTVVILAPNHTGRCQSPGASAWISGVFSTPLGDVPVDAACAAALARACDLVAHDPAAHEAEHAIEVELPFIATLAPEARIVPLVLAWDDWPRSERLAAALAEVVAGWPTGVLIAASSDMTHYESATSAERKDRLALEAVEQLDGRALLDVCRRERISMCGRAPAAVALESARRLGASRADVVDYRHSGFVTGDHRDVVSYAGVVMA
jgi:hypothetical protein